MELNYDGTRDREGFASYIHLNETLFGKCFTNLQSYFNKITYILLIIIFYIIFSHYYIFRVTKKGRLPLHRPY
ncbi:hypothetical protein M5D96_010649 [Drosophila gunungcola]|uniref:Uncharacterized protein n=1 Tax=Drosophila gunungcola TaxID=103775 RepID=A0A9P9YH88_9MUSC|nr:hypothetical protein M5D96_010649 [Drosophila gunungcola]